MGEIPALKPILLVSLLILLLISQRSHAQFNRPSLPDVAREFLSKYYFNSDTSHVVFQRKREGWFIAEESYFAFGTFFNQQLFWSAGSGKYLDLNYLDFTPAPADVKEALDNYLSAIDWSFNKLLYERIVYYNYPGWDWDIIQDYQNKAGLSDTLLESLARAYSNYATGYLESVIDDAFINGDSDRIRLNKGTRPSPLRVKKFQRYMDKALETYALLAKKNPAYTVKVGNVNVKLANEYLFAAMEFEMIGYSKESYQYAVRAKFPDSILTRTSSYLRDVSPNSLLLTDGDNDTYCLWYLQKAKQLRTDVKVINYTMLGVPHYLSYLDRRFPGQLFGAPQKFYYDSSSDYFLFGNNADTTLTIDVEKFLIDLRSGKNPYDPDVHEVDGAVHPKYYSTRLFFSADRQKHSHVFRLGRFVLRGEYALLDILYNNRKKKVYFTYTDTPVFPMLKKYKNLYEFRLN